MCSPLASREWVGEELDGNGDGTITEDEFTAAITKKLEESDNDGNGKVTVKDL